MSDFRIRGAQASALIRIFAEAEELAGNPAAQMTHVLDNLARLVGAAALGEMDMSLQPTGAIVTRSVDHGWATESDRARLYRFYEHHGVAANPFAAALMAGYRPGAELTRRREDLIGDRTWYHSAFYAEVSQPGRLDHSVYSLRPGDAPNTVYGLGLLRAAGDPPFDDEARGVVELCHRDLIPQLRRPTATQLDLRRASLTAREEDVLARLLRGFTDKQIAADLSLSPYTVHQHARAVYRKLGVSGRTELLAREARGARPLCLR